jgi:dipeptidyl aminopeptidase/acylaminoacyl peptidase
MLLLVPMLLSPGPNAAQAPATPLKRLTFEDILAWRLAASPVISPEGKKVAFLLTENQLEKSRGLTHLWWVEVESKQARRLTHLDETVAAPQWSPDGRWLGFLSGRAVDGNTKAQVWLLPVDGGEAFPLTRAPEGVRHWRWAADSKSVFFVTQESPAAAVATLRDQQKKQKNDAVVVDAEKYRREIWRAALSQQKAERIFAGDYGLAEITPSPDGRRLVFRANRTGDPDHESRDNLWLLDLSTRQAAPLVEREGQERSVAWAPDSTRIAFLAPREADLRYSQQEIFVMPVSWAGARPEPARLTRDFRGSIEELHWTRPGSICFAAEVGTGNRLYCADASDGVIRPVSSEAHYLAAPDWSADGSVAATLLESSSSLPEIAVLRMHGGPTEPQRLTDLNPQLTEFTLGAQEVIRWKSKDGKEIEGVLLRPAGYDAARKYPLLVDIHGGPYGRRANTLTAGNFSQAWAARGWLVLQPNFRGSSGYGHEFGLASRGDLGGRDYEDILAGVDFVVARGWADPERLAVMGESYGGYMTNWIIGHTQRFRAAVSAFGLFSLLTDFSNSAYPSWETDYLGKFYWDDLALYVDRSPQKFVQQMQTPVLILHGDEDDNTFISNSREMYQALKLLKRTVKFVRFPREGHGFSEPQHALGRLRETAAWLETHTPGFAGEARAAVEGVRSGAWELRVVQSRWVEDYAGVKPRGNFLEVTVLLCSVEPAEGRYSVLVFDNAGGHVSLASGGRTYYPEGLVAETLGQKFLVKSSAQVVAAGVEKSGGSATLAFTVAFDLPAIPGEAHVTVKDFPAVVLRLPEPKT